jgi:hypothetical protein
MSSTDIYIETLKQISIHNKYFLWYINIINNAIARKEKIVFNYKEKHHILPKSFKLGGETDKSNIVILTAREHYICHLLLIKFSKSSYKTKMYSALWCMVNGSNIKRNPQRNFKINSYVYTDLKLNLSKIRSDNIKGDKNPNKSKERRKILSTLMKGDKNPMKGKHHTECSKRKISIATSGENNPFFGKNHTQESLEKMRNAKKPPQTQEHKNKCRSTRLKTFYFLSPFNEIVEIKDLKLYCKENNLQYNSMLKVNRGEQNNYKGWIKASHP